VPDPIRGDGRALDGAAADGGLALRPVRAEPNDPGCVDARCTPEAFLQDFHTSASRSELESLRIDATGGTPVAFLADLDDSATRSKLESWRVDTTAALDEGLNLGGFADSAFLKVVPADRPIRNGADLDETRALI